MTSYLVEQEIAAPSELVGEAPSSVEILQDEEDDNGVTEIESLCMNCHDNVGQSSLLMVCNPDPFHRASPSSNYYAYPSSAKSC